MVLKKPERVPRKRPVLKTEGNSDLKLDKANKPRCTKHATEMQYNSKRNYWECTTSGCPKIKLPVESEESDNKIRSRQRLIHDPDLVWAIGEGKVFLQINNLLVDVTKIFIDQVKRNGRSTVLLDATRAIKLGDTNAT